MSWLYKQIEPRAFGSPIRWTVGHYEADPGNDDVIWHPESEHTKPEDAANRVNFLNGGRDSPGQLLHLFRIEDEGDALDMSAEIRLLGAGSYLIYQQQQPPPTEQMFTRSEVNELVQSAIVNAMNAGMDAAAPNRKELERRTADGE